MAQAWKQAATDLGFTFDSPFRFTAADGHEFVCAGRLKDFGSPNGTLIFSRFDFATDEEAEAAAVTADALGYYLSGLSPDYYEDYDRERFRATLNDWGWFGPEDKQPSWFSGRIGRDRTADLQL